MKKKILISSLLLGSTLPILPFNFISNNKNNQSVEIENENFEEVESISNVLSEDFDYDTNVFRTKKMRYTTIFINNLTKPVVSPNADVPGFFGAWDTGTIGKFPTAVGWTTPSLFQSWSVELIDHPSLVGQVPAGFAPGLVTALYSDNIHSPVKRNQIFAIVANTANLNAREYWILRYNAIDGSPIKDNNAKMPSMSNAPIPQMTADNGNGSAFALTNDILNNRYLAFYPGRLADLKNDIFGFQLTNDNKIEWLENDVHFSGHSNWSSSISSTANVDYDQNNFVLGLAPLVNKRGSNGAGMALMITTPPVFTDDNGKLNFRVLDLNDDFSAINGFTSKPIVGRTAGIFNTFARGRISVPNNLISLQTVQKHINPHLQLFDFIDDSNHDTYKVQMVIPILRGNEWIFVYLSSVSDLNNSYHVSWGLNGSLSQGSFFSSHAFSTNTMPPNISYNDLEPNEIYITSQANATSDKRFNAHLFTFNTMPSNGPWDPSMKHIAVVNQSEPNNNWKAKNIVIKMPWGEDIYSWSLPSGQNHQVIFKDDGSAKQLQILNTGGAFHESFQDTASWLNWLDGQSKAKYPSEITDAELLTIGTGKKNFFERPTITYPSGSTNRFYLEMYGQPIRDDHKGMIKGVFNFKQDYTMDGIKFFDYESKIAFKVTGLKQKEFVPTSINQNNAILNKLPSELTTENISNYIDIISIPPGGLIDENSWEITNKNNAEGSATVSVRIHPFYNENSDLVTDPSVIKIFSTDVTGLKKVSGTTAVRSSTNISNLTVWDVTDSNAGNFIQVNDLIPGSSINDVTFSVRNQAPLTGQLSIRVSIPGGLYYDPTNKGLPSITGSSPLILLVNFTGFKPISNTGTLVTPRTGPHNGIFPAFIDETNAADFFDITNAVPGSTYTLKNFNRDSGNVNVDFSGKVSFDVEFNKAYNINGFIQDNKVISVTIQGLESGIAPNETLAIQTLNRDLYQNTLAPEIDEDNIGRFIIMVNLPPNVQPKYKFLSQKNTGAPNTGYQDVEYTLSSYYNTAGVLVNSSRTAEIRIEGLKTLSEDTSIIALPGANDTLPQNFNEVADISKYYTIVNPSTIIDKPSSLEINWDSFVKNNAAGTVVFQCQIVNAVTSFGFLEKSNPITLTISGFQRGTVTGIEQIGVFKDFKASEFELSVNNFSSYIRFNGYTIQKTTDEEGNVEGTDITKIQKLSFNDSNGTAVFRATVTGGAINQQGIFTIDEVDITFEIDGFEIVVPEDNIIPIIAGAVGGGVAVIILIVVAIILFNNAKNKKLLNEKRRPTPTNSAPPTPPGQARPTSPPPVNPGVANSSNPPGGQVGPTSPPPQMNPGVARSTPPGPPGATRVAPPAPPSSGRPMPPPRR